MRNLSELNLSESGHVQPTTRQVESVEKLLEARLPASYLEFLKFSNGGSPALNTFYSEFEGNEQRWTLRKFLHLAAETTSTLDKDDVLWAYNRVSRVAPRSILPIAKDSDTIFYCLDLSVTGNGQVVLWKSDEPEFEMLPVADSFEAMLAALTAVPEIS